MPSRKPSIQLYTLRDSIAQNIDETICRVAALGIEQVEPYGFVDRVDEYKAAFSKYGITAPTAHARLIDQDVVPILKAAKELGVQLLIDPSTPRETWNDKEAVDHYAAELNRISAEASSYGIKIGYHNHFWELAGRIDGQISFEYFFEQLDSSIYIELDTYWAEVGGVSAPDFLRKHEHRIAAIHVKDGEKDGNTEKQVPAGQGQIPVAEVLKAAPNALPVIEFDEYLGGDIFDGVAASLKFVREVQA